MAATVEGEERVMAAAQQIVKSLNTPKDVTDDMLLILSSFDNRLSNISDLVSGDSDSLHHRFAAAEQVILRCRWDPSSASPWDETAEYLSAVDDVLRFAADRLSLDPDILDRAESAIQVAMSRLEDEFALLLSRAAVPLDSDRLNCSILRVSLSFATNDGEIGQGFESFADGDRDGCYHERGGRLKDDVSVDLIHPDAAAELREMADRMVRSGYEKECCQVYTALRRGVLDESLGVLGVEKLSIEEVQKMEWRSLDEKMRKWIQAVKVAVRVLLSGEKRLCDQVFRASEAIREVSFAEAAKGCVMQLLNFGEAVAIVHRSSEKLFRILDMYDALSDVLPELQALFAAEPGEFVCSEAKGVLAGLGEAALGTFAEFQSAVRGEASRKPVQGGEIHPLTRYVMNYIKLLVDYSDSLNSLLEEEELDTASSNKKKVNSGDQSMTPLGRQLLSLISCLESNLEEKSRVYEDGAMQYVFLMNNILYIVQKVKDSELGKLLGDQWVRKRSGQIRQYATGYLRAAWSKVLSCLRDEGVGGGSSGNASKVALKERFKNFNACFEDIYRIQTGWKVPDPQLREELRISISEKVLPAYRSFMGRFGHQLESGRHAGKYIKYTPDDLENYLLDLFEGSPCVLNHMRRRSG